MFQYSKKNHQVKIFCKGCKEDISFAIPENLFQKENIKYPYVFRFVHGEPPHSISMYIDKNDSIRGFEFGDSITLSDDLIEKIIIENELKGEVKKEKENIIILKSIFDTFSTVIEAKVPETDKLVQKNNASLTLQLESLYETHDHARWGDKIFNIQKKNENFVISNNKGDVWEFNSQTKKKKILQQSKDLKLHNKWFRIVTKDGNVGFDYRNIYIGMDFSGDSVIIEQIGSKYVVSHENVIIKEQEVNETVNKRT
ncbi:hypothetical protein [Candidatus Lokiarchaeum ossiferum]|uniref:hypothetical protein n=1 Tax=Candidatus Lokiarchaeum ossiferum TaxID=2951803 RepID=UPI00352E7595